MKKVLLHMGLHKTASSSFQLTCKANVQSLYEQGIVYPLFSQPNRKEANHSVPIHSLLTKKLHHYRSNPKVKLSNIQSINDDQQAILYAALGSDKDVILSGEGISKLSVKGLLQLKQMLEAAGCHVMPLVIVRSPYAFHCSSFQQRVKSGVKVDISSFHSQIERVKAIQEVFPDTRFTPFAKACRHPYGPAGFLLEQMGVDHEHFTFVNTNEGVSNALVRMQYQLNQAQKKIINRKANPDWVSLVNVGKESFKDKFLLTESEFSVVSEAFYKENESMETLLGKDFLDENIEFSSERQFMAEIAHFLCLCAADSNDDERFRQAAAKLAALNAGSSLEKSLEIA